MPVLLSPRCNLALFKPSILERLVCDLDRVGSYSRHQSARVSLRGIMSGEHTTENEKDARGLVRPVVPAVNCSSLNAYVASLEGQFHAIVEVAAVDISKATVRWHRPRLTTLFRLDERCRNRETRCDGIATEM
jgi:hypothetical protein